LAFNSLLSESFSINGNAKAAVFPVPVCAWPSKSLPDFSSGIAAFWMGVGF